MVSSYTPNKNLEKPGNGDYVDTWNVPVNGDMNIIDAAFGGTFGVSLTNTNVTLTQTQAQNVNINLTGLLSANVIVYLPASVAGFWIVTNATTGAFTVTIASAGGAPGTSVVVQQGFAALVWSNGSNVRFGDDDRTALIAGNGIQIIGSTISLVAPVTVANGGTGGTDAATARAGIGAAASATQIATGAGLQGGGDLSANRTLSIATGGVTSAMLASGAATGNLGYTPVNRAGDTMTGALNIGSSGSPLTVNSTNSTQNKIILSDNGTVRGYVGATSANCLAVQNAAGSLTTLTVDNSGNLTAAANVTAYSDVRLKKDLVNIENALEIVNRMNGYRYTRIDTGQKEIGLVAQQLTGDLPEIVKQNEEYMSVAYDRIVAVLVEAVKELTKRVEALEAK
jgi:hypothetical protein